MPLTIRQMLPWAGNLRVRVIPFVICLLLGFGSARRQSPLPPLPSDVPPNATIRMVLTDKTPSGQDAVWTTPDGVLLEFYQFNDRGRGPKIYTSYRVDGNGLIVSEESRGATT